MRLQKQNRLLAFNGPDIEPNLLAEHFEAAFFLSPAADLLFTRVLLVLRTRRGESSTSDR